MHVFAEPKTDFVFKPMFGAESRKPLLLIALLNDRLGVEGAARLLDVEHLSREARGGLTVARAEGIRQGLAAGKRESLLRLLTRRRLSPTKEERVADLFL